MTIADADRRALLARLEWLRLMGIEELRAGGAPPTTLLSNDLWE